MNKKTIGILLVIIVILNLVLFALGYIRDLLFWVVIIATALIAYKILPRIK